MTTSTEKKVFKVLLLHLVSNGDCLYATAIARQIKIDYPGCHLTWMISNLCSKTLLNNPHIDRVIEIPVRSVEYAFKDDWYAFRADLEADNIASNYDKIVNTQFAPENLHNFDGTIRSSLFRSYLLGKRKIDPQPVVVLTHDEIKNAEYFVEHNRIKLYAKRVLFECSPASGQSFINYEIALKIAEILVSLFDDVIVILSTHLKFETNNRRIIIANTITFRENAQLARYCNLLLGTSSGITWLCTSSWLDKMPPSIQLLTKKGMSFASVVYDLEYWGYDTSSIVEISQGSPEHIAEIVRCFYQQGVEVCKKKYHEKLVPDPFLMKSYFNILAKRKRIRPLLQLFINFKERNGFSLKLVLAFLFIFLQGVFRIPLVFFSKRKPFS